MKRFIAFLLLSNIAVFSQNSSEILLDAILSKSFYTDSAKLQITTGLDYELNSNRSLPNSLLKDIYVNRTISETSKYQSNERLKGFNTLGLNGLADLSVKYKIDNDKAVFVKAYTSQLASFNFTDDAFKVVTNGNADYAGKTADFSGSSVYNINYQTIGLGLEKKIKSKLYSVGLYYVSGSQYQNYEIKNGKLFTEIDGTYINFVNNSKIEYTDNQKTNLFSNVGAGTSLSFSVVDFDTSKALNYSFHVSDLGFVTYNNVSTFSKDTSYNFDGYEIPNLLQINTSDFLNVRTDSIYTVLGYKEVNQSKTVYLPFKIKTNIAYKLSNKLNLLADLQYIKLKKYMPKVGVGLQYKLCNYFSAFTKITAGGFGGVNSQLGFYTQLPGKIHLYANINALEYLIAPAKTSGVGLQVNLARVF